MTKNEYNRFFKMFSENKSLNAYFIKLNDFVNFDGYLRKEFLNARKIRFEGEYIYFTVEHWTEFRDYELKVNWKDINIFVPSNEKKSTKLPLYLQDINFKEGFIN